MTRFILVPSLLLTGATWASSLATFPEVEIVAAGSPAAPAAPAAATPQSGAASGGSKKEASSSESFEVSTSGDTVTVRMNGKDVPASRIRREADGIVVLDESGKTIKRIPVMTAGSGAPGSFTFRSSGGGSTNSSGSSESSSSSDQDSASDSDSDSDSDRSSARDSSRSSQRSSNRDSSSNARRSSSTNSDRASDVSADAGRMATEIAERMRRETGGFDVERFQREFSERFSREFGETMERTTAPGSRSGEPRRRIRAEATAEGGSPGGQSRMRYRVALPEQADGTETVVEVRPKVMLGVTLAEPDEGLRKHLQLTPGNSTLITQVVEGLPASTAGIEPLDVIVRIEGAEGASPEQVRQAIAEKNPGDSLRLKVNRGGEEREVVVSLEAFDGERLTTADTSAWKALAERFPGVELDLKLDEIMGQLGNLAPDTETLREQLKSLRIAPLPGGRGEERDFIFEFTPRAHGEAPEAGSGRFMQAVPGMPMRSGPMGPEVEERLARMESRLEDVSRMLERVLERLEARPDGDADPGPRRRRDS